MEDEEALAIARGALRRQEILDEPGAMVSESDAAEILRVSPLTIADLVAKGLVLALPIPGKTTLAFPVFQFDRKRASLLDGFEEVLKELNSEPAINAWAKYLFFVSPRHSLSGAAPLALLQRGEIAKAVALAGAYAS